MNYFIDRKRLGIAEIFSAMHPIFSPSNDMNAKETVRLMCEQSFRTRAKIAAGINRAIRRLTSDSTVDVEEYISDEIKNLAETPVRADSLNELLPFMKWLAELHRQNSLAIERSQYSLNDAANYMERQAGEFLRSCSGNMTWQNISVTEEDGGLLLSLTERFWGRAQLFFPDVETSFEGTFPLVGMLFCVEAEHTDDGFEFCFVVNVEFGTDDMELRALQNRNWVRLTFRCGRPQLRTSLFDYGRCLKDFGKRGHGFIEDWCSEAISKEQTLGGASMSEREQELLPLAKIIRIAYQMADIHAEEGRVPDQIAIPNKVLELLGNRYRFGLYREIFTQTGQTELYSILERAVEAWTEDEADTVSAELWNFAGALREKEQGDGVRAFYDTLIGMMTLCTSEFDGVSRIYGSYSEAEEKMRAVIEPKLLENGFTGSYPHYRRRRGKKGEYISVLTSNVNKRTVNGVMTYYFTISAAVTPLERRGKRKSPAYFAAGMPFESAAAEDCAAVRDRRTKYAQLGGEYDGESIEVNIDIFEGMSDEEQTSDSAGDLLRYIDVALNAFRGKAMPRWYRKKRRESSVKYDYETTTGGVFMKYLPFGLYIAALLMGAYVVCSRFVDLSGYIPVADQRDALVISLIAGAALTFFCALLRMGALRRHIWQY
ncbi:MAG: hypothetical protein IJM51_05735 [Clostridia bacterium]|nr:hypothetical protein [Clostridia bacterium]